MPSGVFYFQIENITVCHRIKGPCDKIAGSNFGQPKAARRASAWMARVTKLPGAIKDSRRLPAGRVPGWHESLDGLEQSKTALAARRASAWMARVRVGHLEDSSQSIDDLPRQQRYTPRRPAVNTSM